jgi:hypothetical protein
MTPGTIRDYLTLIATQAATAADALTDADAIDADDIPTHQTVRPTPTGISAPGRRQLR